MKAWRIHRYANPSSALELDEVERPEPGPGQVLIRVRATTINANDIDGVDPPEGAPGWIQERAVTSPIWYSPDVGGFDNGSTTVRQ